MTVVNLNEVADVKKWMQNENHVYVGRPSKWGNPCKLSDGKTRREAVDFYRDYVLNTDHLSKSVGELHGKVLGCWCAPYQCHAEVLHELAGNRPIYQMASTLSETLQFRVTNLGTNVSVEEVLQFLGFVSTDSDRKYCSVALSV